MEGIRKNKNKNKNMNSVNLYTQTKIPIFDGYEKLSSYATNHDLNTNTANATKYDVSGLNIIGEEIGELGEPTVLTEYDLEVIKEFKNKGDIVEVCSTGEDSGYVDLNELKDNPTEDLIDRYRKIKEREIEEIRNNKTNIHKKTHFKETHFKQTNESKIQRAFYEDNVK